MAPDTEELEVSVPGRFTVLPPTNKQNRGTPESENEGSSAYSVPAAHATSKKEMFASSNTSITSRAMKGRFEAEAII